MGENVHRYEVRGQKGREVIKGFCKKITKSLPSLSITPKSMTYRDTTYLKEVEYTT